ncbi:MAG: hypothetical protein LBH06_00420 [Rikenellaceae bacterium]|nr:hypothetical protein [Rikenellaceae bacterium]
MTTGTLERIAEAIGEPASYFYNELPILSLEDYAAVRQTEKEVEMLRKQVKYLQGTINELINKY